jgi:hypothetical protein
MFRKTRTTLFVCGVTFLAALAAPWAFAGGFGLSVELPSAPSSAEARQAALLVRPEGCYAPGAVVSARAEGLVNGHRRSLPLRVTKVSTDSRGVSLYAIQRQWPSAGVWVLTFTGTSHGPASKGNGYTATCNALLELGPNGSIPPARAVAADGRGYLAVRFLSEDRAGVEATLQTLTGKARRNAAISRSAR